MGYTTTTLADVQALLGARLMDPSFVRWTTPELTIYIQQALRTWNALTSSFRDTSTFQTTVSEPFYDLPTVLPNLRAQTYTALDAINEIAYHLLEPPLVGGLWQGSTQFTLPQIVDALTLSRDAFLLQTMAVVTRSMQVQSFNPQGLVVLNEDVINVRRLAWKTPDGIITVLKRDDSWGLTNYGPREFAPVSRPPRAYSVGGAPPLALVAMVPIPTVDASLDLLTVNRGAEIVAPYTDSLGIPNDFAWVVVFGALTELLNKDGIAYDPARAAYCEARWTQGIAVAKDASVVWKARVGSIATGLAAVSDADAYSSSWQMLAGIPQRVVTMGQTLVGLVPPPGVPVGGGTFSVTLSVVRNAPVPVADSDYLQVGPELLDGIVDYAQHLALFKDGIAVVNESKGLLDRFMALSGTAVEINWASAPNRVALLGQTTQDPRSLAYETTNAGTIN